MPRGATQARPWRKPKPALRNPLRKRLQNPFGNPCGMVCRFSCWIPPDSRSSAEPPRFQPLREAEREGITSAKTAALASARTLRATPTMAPSNSLRNPLTIRVGWADASLGGAPTTPRRFAGPLPGKFPAIPRKTPDARRTGKAARRAAKLRSGSSRFPRPSRPSANGA